MIEILRKREWIRRFLESMDDGSQARWNAEACLDWDHTDMIEFRKMCKD